MSAQTARTGEVVRLKPKAAKSKPEKTRKTGRLNQNKEGSVREIGGKVYVDFRYFGERVRECSNLPWNEKNQKEVRAQLDRIMVKIKDGTFRFAEVFPESKRCDEFTKKEKEVFGLKTTPDEVTFEGYAWKWYELRKSSERIAGRTLHAYKGYLSKYLIPFFGENSFAQLNAHRFEEFVAWARKLKLKGKAVSNKSINKYFIPLRMICESAAIEFGWSRDFDPFHGYRRLPEDDARDAIAPFSLEEQKKIIENLPLHWQPYFLFAFASGVRPGEQIAIKPGDIDWEKKLLHINRAITLDADGHRAEGNTKNKYSRRVIKLSPTMLEALMIQEKIHSQLGCEYFFCTPSGHPVHLSNLRRNVWLPTLKEAGVPARPIEQARHSFATMALSSGEDPLWIATVMGHRDASMVIGVYSKYVENMRGSEDGTALNQALQGIVGRTE